MCLKLQVLHVWCVGISLVVAGTGPTHDSYTQISSQLCRQCCTDKSYTAVSASRNMQGWESGLEAYTDNNKRMYCLYETALYPYYEIKNLTGSLWMNESQWTSNWQLRRYKRSNCMNVWMPGNDLTFQWTSSGLSSSFLSLTWGTVIVTHGYQLQDFFFILNMSEMMSLLVTRSSPSSKLHENQRMMECHILECFGCNKNLST